MTAKIPAPPATMPLLNASAPLPPYRYVPGLNPHPFRHPAGHMYTDGCAPDERPWTPFASWMDDERFKLGLDLFNHRYMWEAHEAWEALWHFSGRESPERALLKSLICCAAACLKAHVGATSPAARLCTTAETVMQPWHHIETIYGVRHKAVTGDTRAFLASGPWPVISPAMP